MEFVKNEGTGANRPLRVLHFAYFLEIGGIFSFLHNLHQSIDTSKIQFDYLVASPIPTAVKESILKLGGKCFEIESFSISKTFGHLNHLRKFLCEHPYKIVHIHSFATRPFLPFICWIKKTERIILHAHLSNYSHEKYPTIKRAVTSLATRFANVYMACGESAARFAFPKEYKRDNVSIIRNGLILDNYTFTVSDRDRVRQELGLGNAFVLGHVGRLEVVKNQKFILDVFEELSKRIEAKLLIVGDGSLRESLEARVKMKNIQNKVLFLGQREDIPQLLSAMDYFILPSFSEGLGIALVEAQASGVPSIASENVPSETKLTDLVKFLSLDEGASIWANLIIQHSMPHDPAAINEVRRAGFDIKSEASWLTTFYLSKYRRE